MNLESLAHLAQIVTTLMVAVSLVYLGAQVRQTTKSQQAENYGRALDRLAAMQARLSENEGLSSMFNRAIIDPFSVTPERRVQITWGLYELFGAMEFIYDQHRAGLLPPQVWNRWEATLAWWLRFPGIQMWWRVHPTPFSDELTALVERMLATSPAPAARDAAWREFLIGPRPATASNADRVDPRPQAPV